MTDQKPPRLPSDTLTKPIRRLPWILGGVGAAAFLAIGVTLGPAVAAQFAPAPTATATAAPADTGPVLTADDLTSIQQAATDQQVTIADDKQKAADLAAAQAAADAAAKPTHHSSSSGGGAVHCPAGSFANSNDGVNDTSCFPDICSHIQVPDPAHPECDAAFKP